MNKSRYGINISLLTPEMLEQVHLTIFKLSACMSIFPLKFLGTGYVFNPRP